MNKLLLRSELKRDEGERLRLYKCSSGKFTIGIGRNIEDNGISKDESELMFANDVDRVEKEARSIFGNWKSIEDARQRALVNMLFNLGMTRFHDVQTDDWRRHSGRLGWRRMKPLTQRGLGKWVKGRIVSQTC